VKNIPVTRSQQAVLTALRDQPDLVDIEALARHLGRHPNTLREHLVGLLEAGLIVRYAAPADGRGRPRWLYGTSDAAEVDENAELAASLAWQLARRSRDPLSAAREVSRRWARQIAERYRVVRQPSARAARAQVVEVMDGLGYEPAADRSLDRVALNRCPLLQVAKDVPEVVCNVHLGLVEELLEVSGGDRRRVTLTPFAAPGRCDLRLMAPATDEVRRAAVPSP
jgi:predicted ArsR family transcriptional regulator